MNIAIIVAGGSGKRMELGYNKAFAPIHGKPLLAYTLLAFEQCTDIDSIIIPAGNDKTATGDQDQVKKIVKDFGITKVKKILSGAETRMRSIQNALSAIPIQDEDVILVHDACRPCIKADCISAVISACKEYGASICGVTPKETIQEISKDGFSIHTYNREELISIGTPMAGKWKLIKEAREKAIAEGYLDIPGYEDTALLQRAGVRVKVVPGEYSNIKVTTPEDLKWSADILSAPKGKP